MPNDDRPHVPAMHGSEYYLGSFAPPPPSGWAGRLRRTYGRDDPYDAPLNVAIDVMRAAYDDPDRVQGDGMLDAAHQAARQMLWDRRVERRREGGDVQFAVMLLPSFALLLSLVLFHVGGG